MNGIATADTYCTYIASLPYIYTIDVQHVLMNIMKQCSTGLPCKSYVTARDYESCLGRDLFGVATAHLWIWGQAPLSTDSLDGTGVGVAWSW